MVDGWQLAPQQEAQTVSQPIYGGHLGRAPRRVDRGWLAGGAPAGGHAVSQPIYGGHLGKTRHSLMRQSDTRQTPRDTLRGALTRGVASCARATAARRRQAF